MWLPLLFTACWLYQYRCQCLIFLHFKVSFKQSSEASFCEYGNDDLEEIWKM